MALEIRITPFYSVILAAILDAKFREDLANDPTGTVQAAGFSFSDKEIENLKSLDVRKLGEMQVNELTPWLSAAGTQGYIDPGSPIRIIRRSPK